jgi:pSer/pThr/pTyr-binding forkhead associated (FHA) protein
MSTSTCPYCGAETRPGDNFCLNCGNRLLPATPSPQQAQPVIGESTIPAQDGWSPSPQDEGTVAASSGGSYADPAAMTVASAGAEASGTPSATAQATIERPAKFILRADNGDILQEYPLEKSEIAIGRAPNSDILLSKDKLTSRRHATVRYEDDKYVLYDERSANGTFVNGQQLEEMAPRVLMDGDHIGIGEHELIFRGSSSSIPLAGVSDLPTVSVPYNAPQEVTYRTREDELVTSATSDDFSTKSMDNGASAAAQSQSDSGFEDVPSTPPPVVSAASAAPAPELDPAQASSTPAASTPATEAKPVASASPSTSDAPVTFNRLTNIPQPMLPDIAPLMAALSTLDGQVMSLQEQLNATQDAVRNHEAEIAQTTTALRSGVRRVSERMDNTIADVARSREALAWADLLQLMEDVMNNPRDIEYVTKLARKARELNKVFQLHQNVLNTLAECTSLLRSLVGEDR